VFISIPVSSLSLPAPAKRVIGFLRVYVSSFFSTPKVSSIQADNGLLTNPFKSDGSWLFIALIKISFDSSPLYSIFLFNLSSIIFYSFTVVPNIFDETFATACFCSRRVPPTPI
jgi:hypothetical protein